MVVSGVSAFPHLFGGVPNTLVRALESGQEYEVFVQKCHHRKRYILEHDFSSSGDR